HAPEMARIVREYGPRGVQVFGVHPDPDVTATVAAAHAKEYGLPFPVLLDPTQLLSGRLGVRVTPEAVVLSPTGAVLYHGRIDDRYGTDGKRRETANVRDLRNALDAVLDGKPVAVAETRGYGCPLPKPADPK